MDQISGLFEKALGHLIEAAAPGEELVGGSLGDEALSVVAGSLQVGDALVDAVVVTSGTGTCHTDEQ